ncbi:unnamed protein product [Sphenostylis stenocarpa]|uniref:Uncharacterized protein n=1 Tax=Sphenostylis stenocarpa TaxID=92480 RepID=A0AA86VQN2_9FABA|nr:unnamed protein product [Sphenostylis stenocarpa]
MNNDIGKRWEFHKWEVVESEIESLVEKQSQKNGYIYGYWRNEKEEKAMMVGK